MASLSTSLSASKRLSSSVRVGERSASLSDPELLLDLRDFEMELSEREVWILPLAFRAALLVGVLLGSGARSLSSGALWLSVLVSVPEKMSRLGASMSGKFSPVGVGASWSEVSASEGGAEGGARVS